MGDVANVTRHRVTTSGQYEIPFGTGKRYGANLPGFLQQSLGNWQISSIFVKQTGNFGNVTFSYVVTNMGTADLVNVHLVDDNATPGNASDDVVVTCPSTSLAAGASMTCTVTLPA